MRGSVKKMSMAQVGQELGNLRRVMRWRGDSLTGYLNFYGEHADLHARDVFEADRQYRNELEQRWNELVEKKRERERKADDKKRQR